MNVIPDLAERWETPDPLTYISIFAKA